MIDYTKDLQVAWQEVSNDVQELMQGHDITMTASGLSDHIETQARLTAAQAIVSWLYVRMLSRSIQAAGGE